MRLTAEICPILDRTAKGVFLRWSASFLSSDGKLNFRRSFTSYGRQNVSPLVRKVSCSNPNKYERNYERNVPNEGPAAPPQTRPNRPYSGKAGEDEGYTVPNRSYDTVPRRPPDLEARMRMKAYRREALSKRRLLEEDEDVEVDFSKLLQKGAPRTMQGIIREVMTVGFFVTLPKGKKEGFLPGTDLGTTGGESVLSKIWKEGQEITVRIIPKNDGAARELLTVLPDKDEAPDGTRLPSTGGTNVKN